ncbi:type II toxin-antitoxin system VapC family toxin [Gloeobacter morelensis]|uniref:type II toxin-antitoxin system VapC family toxin n=1 Tax=Gloeobacter morelensis TaxID=2907343 RepID=UPI001E5F8C42|nr:type II toxin-antitoxin system VapC family toxin [Gloeobacter morelensis]
MDTHAFLWFVGGDPRLSDRARMAIKDLANTRLLSVASAWELAIKVSFGKLTLHVPFVELIPKQLDANAIELLPIKTEPVHAIATLPLFHRDPFDRMLVAQSLLEDAALVTTDATLDEYGVRRLW